MKQGRASFDLSIGWALSIAVVELVYLHACVTDKQQSYMLAYESKIISQQLYDTSLGNNKHIYKQLPLVWKVVFFKHVTSVQEAC